MKRLFSNNPECPCSFFFKHWGGVNKKAAGRLLEGRTWDELPTPKRRPEPMNRSKRKITPNITKIA